MWQTGNETISRTPAPLSDLSCVRYRANDAVCGRWMDAQHPNKLKLPVINFNCRMSKTLCRWFMLCTDSEVKSHIFTYAVLACSDFTISHGRKTGFDFVRTCTISAQFAINIRYVCLLAITNIRASNRQQTSTTLCVISESLEDVAISLQLASFVRNFEFFQIENGLKMHDRKKSEKNPHKIAIYRN